MTEPTAEFTFGSWTAPQVALAIEYPLEIMDEIRAAATDGLQRLARGGLEVAGVLFGVRRETGVRLLTWRPISCEYALGPTFQLSSRDRADLARLLETAPADPDLKGLQPAGWFVSHTRSDIMLTPTDLEIFNSVFPEPWQVTLVLQPSQAGAARAGFFAREADGQLQSASSYQEFTIKPLRRASRMPEQPVSVPRDRARTRIESLGGETGPRRSAMVEPPSFRTLERAPQRRRWLWLLPVVLALITAAFLLKEKYLASDAQSFSFHVSEAGEMVLLEWDHEAPPIRAAHLAVIDITDSGETKRYSLADDELRQGKMSYLRRGGDLEFRMTLYPAGSKPVQEFARFLVPGGPASVPEIDRLRKERDQLETEVNQLQEDLRKERAGRRRSR